MTHKKTLVLKYDNNIRLLYRIQYCFVLVLRLYKIHKIKYSFDFKPLTVKYVEVVRQRAIKYYKQVYGLTCNIVVISEFSAQSNRYKLGLT